MEELEDRAASTVAQVGEHHVVFHHPSGSVPGELILNAEQPPQGTAFDLPLPEDGAIRDPDGTYRGHGFPSVERLPMLQATLRSNLPAWLENVVVSHWMPGHAFVSATAAIVGWAAEGSNPLFNRISIQASGFSQLFGTRPLRSFIAPGLFDGTGLGEVTISFDEHRDLEWATEHAKVVARWNVGLTGIGDAFHFEIRNSPWIDISLNEAVSWQAWRQDWLQPIVDLVSLSTGEAQQPTVVEVYRAGGNENDPSRHLSARVFGSGVRQAAFHVRFGHRRPALFVLADLPYPFAELIDRWRALRSAVPGFVDAYLPIVRGGLQTPAATLLLLSSAAEAIHTARLGAGPTTSDHHTNERRDILRRVSPFVSEGDLKFLKRHVARRDLFSLEQRIRALVADCPADAASSLQLVDLPKQVSSFRNDLSHGRAVAAQEIVPVVAKLRSLLNIRLLIELGIPLDRVVAHESWKR